MGYSSGDWAQGGALDVMAPSAELVAGLEAARKAGAVAELVRRHKAGAGERADPGG